MKHRKPGVYGQRTAHSTLKYLAVGSVESLARAETYRRGTEILQHLMRKPRFRDSFFGEGPIMVDQTDFELLKQLFGYEPAIDRVKP